MWPFGSPVERYLLSCLVYTLFCSMIEVDGHQSLFCFAVFRQGDIGTNWYIVLSGSLEVLVSETGDHKVTKALQGN